jgi:hypothetical protein
MLAKLQSVNNFLNLRNFLSSSSLSSLSASMDMFL